MDYFLAPGCSWREALDFPGSTYVGMLGKVLAGLPTTDMRPGWSDVLAPRCLIVPGTLFVNYASIGSPLMPESDHPLPRSYRIVDPRDGSELARGVLTEARQPLPDTGSGPRVSILFDQPATSSSDA